MAASKEWTEWHLTPQGWVRGSEREDFAETKRRNPPVDRVLTVLYKEVISSACSGLHKNSEETWSSGDKDSILLLKKKFGECPNVL